MARHAERAANLREGIEDLRDSLWVWHDDDVSEAKLRRAWGELLGHALEILAADDGLLGCSATRDWLRDRRHCRGCWARRAFEQRSARGLEGSLPREWGPPGG